MKIIFLDFDGVLNSLQSVYYWKNRGEDFPDNWCPVACNNLNLLLNNFPDLGIVISSTWRGHGMERCKQVLKKHNIDTSQIIGMTPKLWKERGYEIEEWLNTNQDKKIEDFIILDDSSDMGPYLNTPHFIQTDDRVGFDYICYEKASKYFLKANLTFKDLIEGKKYHSWDKPWDAIYFKKGLQLCVYRDGEDRDAYYSSCENFWEAK